MTLAGERWLTSRFTGVLAALDPIPLRAHDPRVFLWAATTAPRSGGLVVGGAGWTSDEARDACLGEAVERWDSAPRPSDGAVTCAARDWARDEPLAGPERWVLFSLAQYAASGFPFEPFRADTVARWLAFRHAATGEPCWVPEELATLHARRGHHHLLASMSSTGLSAGCGAHPTVLRGAQEVVERDALVRSWWGEYPLEGLEPAEVFAALGSDIERAVRRPNLTFAFYRIDTPFSANVTLVTVTGDDVVGPCFSVGSACRETRRGSLAKALLEAIQGRHYVRHSLGELATSAEPGPSRADGSAIPADFPSHALFYSLHPKRLRETVLGRAPERHATLDDEPEPLGALVERLGPRHPPLFRLVTPPTVSSAARGLRVVRVVIPGLVPLHGDHRLAHLAVPRWREQPYERWIDHPPHPFA